MPGEKGNLCAGASEGSEQTKNWGGGGKPLFVNNGLPPHALSPQSLPTPLFVCVCVCVWGGGGGCTSTGSAYRYAPGLRVRMMYWTPMKNSVWLNMAIQPMSGE